MGNPVVHWEIGGHDLDALRTFYAEAFGWTMSDAGPGYCLVQAEGGGLPGGLMQMPPERAPYVTLYVQVDDLEKALRDVTGLGGQTLVAPTAINETASFALFRDPEGNVVGLLTATGPIIGG